MRSEQLVGMQASFSQFERDASCIMVKLQEATHRASYRECQDEPHRQRPVKELARLSSMMIDFTACGLDYSEEVARLGRVTVQSKFGCSRCKVSMKLTVLKLRQVYNIRLSGHSTNPLNEM